ncbi:hypothetical protein [Shewanella sp. SR43-8]|uniref:hypothetical protein n=1 Tax=Shewanella sp. SR43-8 TaxID=2760938 RepID=UPI00160213C6|nr:hypothetical protein [Shewanella sp. SR43-8]MBB1320588.1 hypothetical protein [Shewanella sp. SR43-8]
MNIDTLLLIFGGQTVVLGALFAYLGTIWINRIKTNEVSQSNRLLAKLQSELKKNLSRLSDRNESVVHTHKYLVEVEYNHYQKIWDALTRVSPLFDSVEKNLTNEDDISVTATELHEARVALGNTLSSAYPFINKAIYDMAYLALAYSTKASACLWSSDTTIKPQNEIVEELSQFKLYAEKFYAYNRNTGDGIHTRTAAMVSFHDQ